MRKGSVNLPVDTDLLSQKDVIPAQELLKQSALISKCGFLKCKEKRFGRWSRKFIVLTRDRIFIYEKETSKAPHASIGLLGYKGVCRYTSKSKSHAPWAFTLVVGLSGLHPQKFSGASDKERVEWMDAVKTSMYAANCIEPPSEIEVEANRKSIQNFGGESENSDAIYERLEKNVFELDSSVSAEVANDDGEFSDEDDIGSSTNSRSSRRDFVLSPNSRQSNRSSSTSGFSEATTASCSEAPVFGNEDIFSDEDDECYLQPITEQTRRSSEPTRPRPNSDGENRTSDCFPDVPDYMNFEEIRKAMEARPDYDVLTPRESYSLENMCSVVNSPLSREELLVQLKRKPAGTYMIRKSRQDSQNVISFHTGNGDVKEFKIFKCDDGSLTLDSESHFFSCLGDLLRAYTVTLTLPKTDHYLIQGFHRSSMDQIPEEENDYQLIPDQLVK